MAEHKQPLDENERLRQFAALDKSTLPPDGGNAFNRLIFAESPYLLQHAQNPVDWYQWGEDAFAKARVEDKPIFLSIGYATCHWCHVMAHESFEDNDVAAVLNSSFVAIKVDREERPDIDDQYMAVAQMISGSGGWPLTIIMTAEKRPFFAATYLPKVRRMGLPGIIELLGRISQFWHTERDKVEENCTAVMAALANSNRGTMAEAGFELEEKAFQQLDALYDLEWGGFGQAPKFPMPHYTTFLLRFWKGAGKPEALQMAEKTLTMMRQGGIYDQLGYGIHRYSVDGQWLVPHFEKMLYDQAMVAIAFAETFQATGNERFGQVAREILNYTLQEMSGPAGGFCSAQDADTEGEEGKFYVWTPAEIRAALGDKAAATFCRLFDVTEHGNFEGRNILHLPLTMKAFAAREGLDQNVLEQALIIWRAALLKVREKRIRPLRDAKVLTAWNGLMIAALAKGYGISGDDTYLRAADEAASFLLNNLQTKDGRILRSYHLRQAKIPGFLEDYAFFAWGLLELYQVSLNPQYLEQSVRLTREMVRLFAAPDGGFFDSGSDAEAVLIRQKSSYDGALPSGNSIAAMNLLRLGRILREEQFLELGEKAINAFVANALQQPAAYLQLVAAHDYQQQPEVEITMAGEIGTHQMQSLIAKLSRRFIPGLVLRHGNVLDKGSINEHPGTPVAFVCAKGACLKPVSTPDELEQVLTAADL